ncbi:MAG: hypothetical protein P8165_04190 [Deltaproteobacteria bacterium]
MTTHAESATSSLLEKSIWKVVAVVGILLSLFELYTAGVVAMTAMRQRAVFLTCILILAFLTRPLHKGARQDPGATGTSPWGSPWSSWSWKRPGG